MRRVLMGSMYWTAAVGLLFLSHSQGASAREAQDILIKRAYVMTMDPGIGDRDGVDILIKQGKIAAIGKDLKGDAARQIDADGMIVMPGFVDTHSHLWVTTMRGQFRNKGGKFFPVSSKLGAAMSAEDSYTAMYTGALELLDSGITATADFYDNIRGPEWGVAGLKALDDSGIRAVMYYGGPDKTTKNSIDIAQLNTLAHDPRWRGADARVRLGLGWRLPRELDDSKNWAMRQREFDAAQAGGLPIQVHVSGTPGPMFDALIERGYLNPSVTVVHGTDATVAQMEALNKAGASLALTPISEDRVGYGLTRVDHFEKVARKGFGIDGNSLAGSADMFATLRLAALTWSGSTKDEAGPYPRALLEMATRGGADVIGMSNQIGTLSVGKRADLLILNLGAINTSGFAGGDPAALVVYSARPGNVDTVIVDGQILKQGGSLTGIDLKQVLRDAEQSSKEMLEQARVLRDQ